MEKIINDLLVQCTYKYKDLSKRDITQALCYFKELTPKQDKHAYPNGQIKDLLTLNGTIPVNFKSSRYNIPIQLYLSDLHPYTPPIAYVRPTNEMSINVSTSVDSNGRVLLPCLTEWNYPHSDLYMLLNIMTMTFSENTPLFAKTFKPVVVTAAAAASINPGSIPPYPVDNRTPYPMPGSGNHYAAQQPMPGYGYDQPAANSSNTPVYPSSTNNPYYPGGHPRTPPQLAQNPTVATAAGSSVTGYSDDTIKPEYYRMSLISAITDKIRFKYLEAIEAKQAEVDSLKRVNDDLIRSQSYLDSLINDASSETLQIDELCQQLSLKSLQLSENLNRIQHRDKASIDDAIVTPTPLYRQILQLYSEELALQDLIYYLSEGLSRGSVSLDSFLKQVRLLTRKQFMLRATMQKARERAALSI
jgi:ESCRT-I complex subunit TSG101